MTVKSSAPLALVILDGWGYSPRAEGNAIALADTPNFDEICAKYPMTLLEAAGERVGLPEGTAGSSEVGHMNIGTGRVVRTNIARINNAIETGEFFNNPFLTEAILLAKERGAALHLVGLLSNGNVHSAQEHLFALLRMAKKRGLKNVFIHCTLDGRDVAPNSADIFVEALEVKIGDIGCGRIATLCGRRFTMDREVHLERTARAFTMLVHAEGDRVFDAVSAIRGAYLRGLTDDAIPPIVLESKPGVPVATVKDNDVIVFFNYRGDRMRQLARALIWDKHGTGDAAKPQIDAYSLTDYGLEIAAAFPNEPERNTLSDILRQHGRRDCRITETEKHAHLTYFFDGCKEVSDGVGAASRRVLVPSREFKRPGEAVFEVTRSFTRELRRTRADLFVINLAAADLAAHSGDLEITKQAVSFTDEALGEIVRKMQDASGITLITADHGYCEQMIDPKTGETSFSHSTNPVPFCVVGGDLGSLRLRGGGALEDIAPTILAMLDLPKPPEMTGRDLRAGAANSAQPPRVIPETEKSLAIRELEIA